MLGAGGFGYLVTDDKYILEGRLLEVAQGEPIAISLDVFKTKAGGMHSLVVSTATFPAGNRALIGWLRKYKGSGVLLQLEARVVQESRSSCGARSATRSPERTRLAVDQTNRDQSSATYIRWLSAIDFFIIEPT